MVYLLRARDQGRGALNAMVVRATDVVEAWELANEEENRSDRHRFDRKVWSYKTATIELVAEQGPSEVILSDEDAGD